jgi:hypothetical protein
MLEKSLQEGAHRMAKVANLVVPGRRGKLVHNGYLAHEPIRGKKLRVEYTVADQPQGAIRGWQRDTAETAASGLSTSQVS